LAYLFDKEKTMNIIEAVKSLGKYWIVPVAAALILWTAGAYCAGKQSGVKTCQEAATQVDAVTE
jgi:hypothetical protein